MLDKGKVYGELDVTFKPNNDSGNVVPRFSSFVPRVVVGTGGRVEIGSEHHRNINPGRTRTTLVPAIKYKPTMWRQRLGHRAGDNLFIPVRNKSYDVGNYVYAQASKIFESKTRVTFGGYHFSVTCGCRRSAGGRSVWVRTANHFDVWRRGRLVHRQARLRLLYAGINFKPHPKVTGYVGYSIGNTGASNGNHFVYTAIGMNFN